MATLPVSVRVALWATAAFAGRVPLGEVARLAVPDADSVVGLPGQLPLWRDLGEQAVLVALPRPGDTTGMPGGPPGLLAAATAAEELVYVPGVGGAMVPTVETFGPAGDQGLQVSWTAYEADPVPTHLVEALALPDIELRLRRELTELTGALDAVGAAPINPDRLRGVAQDRGAEQLWGVPTDLPQRALRVIALAGTVADLADLGLDDELHTAAAATTARREQILQRVRAHAASALAEATNVAVMHLAGWR